MASPASIEKHPVHPMLVAIPIGLWVFALVCDVVHATGGDAVWQTVATYCIAAGIVGALVAAVPGLIDYFSIDEAAMKKIANLHMAVKSWRRCHFCHQSVDQIPCASGEQFSTGNVGSRGSRHCYWWLARRRDGLHQRDSCGSS
jgi:hypothetical protein